MQERKHHGVFFSDFFFFLHLGVGFMEKEFCLNCVGLVFNHRLDLEKMNSTSPNNRLQKNYKNTHLFLHRFLKIRSACSWKGTC